MARVQHDPDVVRITGARQGLSDDLRARQRRYLWSMAVRTVAFVAAVALLRGWARWVGIFLAVALPWVAVVVANAGRSTASGPPLPQAPPPDRPRLTAGDTDTRRGPVTVRGSATERVEDTGRDHTDEPPTAPGVDGPVELTTSRRT